VCTNGVPSIHRNGDERGERHVARESTWLLRADRQAGAITCTRAKYVRSRSSILLSRERQDLVGRHLDVGTPTQSADDRTAAASAILRADLSQLNGVSLDAKFDFGLGQKAKPLSNVPREGHLAFGRDPHS
jgi:hypothetical protein